MQPMYSVLNNMELNILFNFYSITNGANCPNRDNALLTAQFRHHYLFTTLIVVNGYVLMVVIEGNFKKAFVVPKNAILTGIGFCLGHRFCRHVY